MGGASSSLHVRPWQSSGKDKLNCFSNPQTRSELKRHLLDEQLLRSELQGATKVNPAIGGAIYSVIGGGGAAAAEEPDDGECGEIGGDAKRGAAVELLIGTVQRLNNVKILNFFIVVLSLLALAFNVPVAFWRILSGMRLLFSKYFTVQLAKELGDKVAAEELPNASQNVGFLVADNKCYMMRQKHMHADVDADGAPRANGEMLYTNNRLSSPVELETEVNIESGEHPTKLIS